MTAAEVVERLVREAGASRATLRVDTPGEAFPVVEEALAPGAPSIRDERSVDLASQPVVRQLRSTHAQVVQDDCRAAFADPAFHAMLDAYGGLGAQIVTPVLVDGRLAGILSLHQLGGPRRWTAREQRLAAAAADELAALLAA